jgi:hypothetical protein
LIPESGSGADAGLGMDVVTMWVKLEDTTSLASAERQQTMPYLSVEERVRGRVEDVKILLFWGSKVV